MPVFRVLAVGLLLVSVASATELTTLVNGTNKVLPNGELISLNGKECVFKGPDGPTTTPLGEVVTIGLLPEPPATTAAHTLVELTDGSLFRCKPEGVTFDGTDVKLALLAGPEIKVPLKALASIVKQAETGKVRDNSDLKKLLKKNRDSDGLVIWYGNSLNEVAGTVTEGKGTVVTFKPEKADVAAIPIDILKKETLQALLFANKPDLTRPPSACKVIGLNKDLLMAGLVETKEGGPFEITLLAGAKITLPRDQVAVVDYSKGRFDFLSEMEPVIAEEPGEDFLVRYRFYPPEEKDKRNKTLAGGPLVLAGRRFERGLCLPAPTSLVYDLKGEFKEFAAVVGIDDVQPGNSHVHLTLEGDGAVIFEGDFDRSKAPLEVRRVVKDVQKLRLTVKSIGVLDLWNHLDIADAKVTK